MDWLTADIRILLITAVTIGVVHTIIGPDHYVPFVAIGRERAWSLTRTLAIVGICGIGHCLGSVLLGVIGVAFGVALGHLEAFEGVRGNVAAWALLAFGLAYVVWGIRRHRRGHVHTHEHAHADGTVHTHAHSVDNDHLHVHAAAPTRPLILALLVVFLLGPCEALIPILMYPAAHENIAGVVAVATVFSVTTVATMMFTVTLGLHAAQRFSLRVSHGLAGVISGAVIGTCGLAMLLGL